MSFEVQIATLGSKERLSLHAKPNESVADFLQRHQNLLPSGGPFKLLLKVCSWSACCACYAAIPYHHQSMAAGPGAASRSGN